MHLLCFQSFGTNIMGAKEKKDLVFLMIYRVIFEYFYLATLLFKTADRNIKKNARPQSYFLLFF